MSQWNHLKCHKSVSSSRKNSSDSYFVNCKLTFFVEIVLNWFFLSLLERALRNKIYYKFSQIAIFYNNMVCCLLLLIVVVVFGDEESEIFVLKRLICLWNCSTHIEHGLAWLRNRLWWEFVLFVPCASGILSPQHAQWISNPCPCPGPLSHKDMMIQKIEPTKFRISFGLEKIWLIWIWNHFNEKLRNISWEIGVLQKIQKWSDPKSALEITKF